MVEQKEIEMASVNEKTIHTVCASDTGMSGNAGGLCGEKIPGEE